MVKLGCVVPGCSSNSTASRHTFPKIRELAEKWRALIKSPKIKHVSWYDLREYVVCERHFTPACFGNGLMRRKLRCHSLPTLNLTGNPSDKIKKRRLAGMGIPRCVVPDCEPDYNVAVHHFPRNIKISSEWRVAVNSPRLKKIPADKLYPFTICQNHFSPDDYMNTSWRRKLRKTAVPNRNLTFDFVTEVEQLQENIEKTHDIESNIDDKSNIVENNNNDIVSEDINQVIKPEKMNPQEYLMAIEKTVTKMIRGGLLTINKNCLNSLPNKSECNKTINDSCQQLQSKIDALELELKISQQTLQSYQLRVDNATKMVKSSFYEQWSKLNDKQRRLMEIQMMNITSSNPDSEVNINFHRLSIY